MPDNRKKTFQFLPLLTILAATILAAILTGIIHTYTHIPLQAATLLFLLTSVWSFSFGSQTLGISYLPRVMLLALWLTYGTVILYLFDPHFTWASETHPIYPLTQDPSLISLLALTGTVSLLGLISGIQLANILLRSSAIQWASSPHPARSIYLSRPIPLPFLVLIALLCIAFYTLATPSGFIFWQHWWNIIHTSSFLSRGIIGSGGIFYIIYAIIIVLLIESLKLRQSPHDRIFKFLLFLLTLLSIVIILDLFKGNRESTGVIVAAFGLYMLNHFPKKLSPTDTPKLIRITLIIITTGLLFWSLDVFREQLAYGGPALEYLAKRFSNILADGTWQGGLHTNLVTMLYFYEGHIDWLWGYTYFEYMLSLPPSQIAQLIGYERPLESYQGPAWWFEGGYTTGGLSPTVVPFFNFGAPGLFFMMLLQGLLFGLAELWARSKTMWSTLTYVAICLSSLIWYWYGDMPFIRSLMATMIVGIVYKITTPSKAKSSTVLTS